MDVWPLALKFPATRPSDISDAGGGGGEAQDPQSLHPAADTRAAPSSPPASNRARSSSAQRGDPWLWTVSVCCAVEFDIPSPLIHCRRSLDNSAEQLRCAAA